MPECKRKMDNAADELEELKKKKKTKTHGGVRRFVRGG